MKKEEIGKCPEKQSQHCHICSTGNSATVCQPISSIKLKTHYHTILCLVTPFLHSLCSLLPFTIHLNTLPSYSLAFSLFPTPHLLPPSFVHWNAGTKNARGRISHVCVCLGIQGFRSPQHFALTRLFFFLTPPANGFSRSKPPPRWWRFRAMLLACFHIKR